tara:strand:+ start:881 stop:1165 length:285 start_codon:yes stop_codon:yes gene_type:complete
MNTNVDFDLSWFDPDLVTDFDKFFGTDEEVLSPINDDINEYFNYCPELEFKTEFTNDVIEQTCDNIPDFKKDSDTKAKERKKPKRKRKQNLPKE